jgi:DNA-binding HxlR family transcriptional regulator
VKTCPHIEAVFEVLGRKWNGRITHYLATCHGSAARFSEIERDVGSISPRALSLKLRELIGFELIEKRTHGESPATASYALTQSGRELVEAMQPLQQWAKNQLPAIRNGLTSD